MVKYKPIGYGENADDVKFILPMPKQSSAKPDVGGIFGSETKPTAGIMNTVAPTATTGNNPGYQESDIVKRAQDLLQQQTPQQTNGYQSTWQSQLNDILDKIQNREKFSYDLNADALYQQYKDQHLLQGQRAMMDTMGQAAAMTGGYGNSYAQTAGQQAYMSHIQGLNDRIPELYQLALSKYQMDGDAMKERAALIAQMDDRDYGRYRDQVADEQWKKEFDEAVRRYNYENDITTPNSGTDGSDDSDAGGYGSGGLGGPNYDNGGLTESQIKILQKALGMTANGKWDAITAAAAQKKWGTADADAAMSKFSGGKSDVFKEDSTNNTGTKLTYSDVALTAAQMRKAGASKQEINEYLLSVVNSSNYTPTTSVAQDLAELRSGYVGTGR